MRAAPCLPLPAWLPLFGPVAHEPSWEKETNAPQGHHQTAWHLLVTLADHAEN